MDIDNNTSGSEGEGAAPSRVKSQIRTAYKCPICINFVSNREPMVTPCGHVFCKVCIRRTIISTHRCPLCNKGLRLFKLRRIYL